MQTSVSVLLVDDHAVLRAGLRALLHQQKRYKIVGEAETSMEAITLAEALEPDLIILDLTMPGLNGLDAIPIFRQKTPSSKILILTMHDDAQYMRQAIKLGAAGYVLKRAADTELLSAMDAVLRGDIYIHSSFTHVLIDDLVTSSLENQTEFLWDTLSDREREVLLKVAMGYTSNEIAEMLKISNKTVQTHKSRGMEKLGLQTRAALVHYTLKHGLLQSDK